MIQQERDKIASYKLWHGPIWWYKFIRFRLKGLGYAEYRERMKPYEERWSYMRYFFHHTYFNMTLKVFI
jgi:hypothetical protein